VTSTPTGPATAGPPADPAPRPGFPRGIPAGPGGGGPEPPERVAWLALDDVAPSPENPRRRFDAEDLAELAESIRIHGVLEPVLVRPLPAAGGGGAGGAGGGGGPGYVLVAGERRWRAARLAGLTRVPALVREGLSDADALRLALIENLQRRDLDPLEEAAGYRRLRELGLTQAQVAAAVHRSQPAVANALRLLDLPEEVREAIQDGRLSPAHGRALAGYKAFPALQRALAAFAIKEQWPSKRLEDKECLGAYRLEEAGVVKRMGYGAPFDVAVCQRCPFDAYRNLQVGGAVCLRPAHYAELAAAAEAERAARTKAAVEEAQRAGTTLPKLSELGYGAYERLDSPSRLPAGCTGDGPAACPCRGQALDGYSHEVVAICTDPRRYRKLRAADTRAANAERQAWREAALKRLDARLERLTDPAKVTGQEIAVLALLALQTVHGAGSTEVLRAAVRRHGGDWTPALEAARLAEVRRWDRAGVRRALAALGALDAATAVRVVLAAAVRDELTTWDRHPGIARWLGVVADADGVAGPGDGDGAAASAGSPESR
jgi:ParB family transcriptional regulator, chromosome partitioning protein